MCTVPAAHATVPDNKVVATDSLQRQQAAAASGDPAAMVVLAWRYYRTRAAPADAAAALRWFRAAADKGSSTGTYGVALCERDGIGMQADPVAANASMRRAADLGSGDAQNDIGARAAAAGDQQEAYGWYVKAAANDNSDAMWRLGRAYLAGQGVPANPVQAQAWLLASARQGNAIGMYYLATALDGESGITKDLYSARTWFAKAAALGDPDARFELANMLAAGSGGERNTDEALRLYRQGAAENHKDSIYKLATVYREGRGVRIDSAEADRWLVKGIALGDPRAMVQSGRNYLTGEDRRVDDAAAEKLFARAAQAGDAYGALWLGICLEGGRGVAKDEAAAARWYEQASEGGVVPALNKLIAMRLDGRGGARNGQDPRTMAQASIDREIARGNAANMLDLVAELLARFNVAEADRVMRQVLDTPAPAGSRATLAYAHALGRVGKQYFYRQQYDSASTYTQAQLALLEKLPDPPRWAVANSIAMLGSVDMVQRRFDAAEAAFRRALALRLQLQDGEYAVASSYEELAQLAMERDRIADAEALSRKALALKEAVYGGASTPAAEARVYLAQILSHAGKYTEAEPLLVQALDNVEKELGKDNPRIGNALNELAYNEMALGHNDRAEQAFRRLLALRLALDMPRPNYLVGSTMNSLGTVLTAEGKFDEAQRTLLEGLAMREQVLGADHPDVAISLISLAKLYIATGRFEQADRASARALTILEASEGTDHSEVAEVLHEQGRSLHGQGKSAEAAQALQRALAIRLRTLPGHPDTVATATLLAAVYRAGGDDVAAQAVEQKLASSK